jgi:hypothetical protein
MRKSERWKVKGERLKVKGKRLKAQGKKESLFEGPAWDELSQIQFERHKEKENISYLN